MAAKVTGEKANKGIKSSEMNCVLLRLCERNLPDSADLAMRMTTDIGMGLMPQPSGS